MKQSPIEICVKTVYLDQHSDDDEPHHIWAYHITIANHSDDIVRLLSRHWHISADTGFNKEVKGEGVVGKQPVLNPGESFEYASSTSLNSRSGMMFGSYEMENTVGNRFWVDIPPFSLDVPGNNNFIH